MASVAAADPENKANILSYVDPRFAAMQKEAQALWPRRDAICNLEGFSQHYGDCVNDMIQMFYTSSDSVKEVVQKQLIFTDYDKFDFNKALRKEDETELIDPEMLRIYIKAFQNRFMRHYLNEEMLCMRGEEKARNALYRSKGRNTKRAMTALKLKQYNTNAAPIQFKDFNRSKSSLHPTLIPPIMRMLARVFRVNKEFQAQAFTFIGMDTLVYTPKVSGFIFGISAVGRVTGHALCFYECGGKQFMYDDNMGPYRCDWRSYFEFIEARKKVGKITYLLFGPHIGALYYPYLYLKEENKLVFIEYGKWEVVDEEAGKPKQFKYGVQADGSHYLVDLSETKAYSIRAIMPLYGSGGLVKRIAEPGRTRRQLIAIPAEGYKKPELKDPAIVALLAAEPVAAKVNEKEAKNNAKPRTVTTTRKKKGA
jgi:hypothetical protein